MKAAGYQDVRIFFVPFFGAVTVGQKQPAAISPRKRVIVSLSGPMPGLAAGAVLLLVFGPASGAARDALWLLLIVNAFNLLPLEPLDGGRVVGDLLASRAWALEASFAVVSGLGFVALGWFLKWPLLAVLGAMGLARLPRRKHVRQLVGEVRSRWMTPAPTPPEALPEQDLGELAARLDPLLTPSRRGPEGHARELRSLWDAASQEQAGPLPTLALLALYVASCFGAFVALALFWSFVPS